MLNAFHCQVFLSFSIISCMLIWSDLIFQVYYVKDINAGSVTKEEDALKEVRIFSSFTCLHKDAHKPLYIFIYII